MFEQQQLEAAISERRAAFDGKRALDGREMVGRVQG